MQIKSPFHFLDLQVHLQRQQRKGLASAADLLPVRRIYLFRKRQPVDRAVVVLLLIVQVFAVMMHPDPAILGAKILPDELPRGKVGRGELNSG